MAKKIFYGVLTEKGILSYVGDEETAKKVAGPTDEVVPLEKVDNSKESE